jgi:hypothetical protein
VFSAFVTKSAWHDLIPSLATAISVLHFPTNFWKAEIRSYSSLANATLAAVKDCSISENLSITCV